MPKYTNVNGVWKQEAKGYVNVNGVWKTKSSEYLNVNGIWKQDNPYRKAVYYGVAYSRYQNAGTQSFTSNSDGSYTVTSMGDRYSDSEDYDSGVYRLAFSTPYTFKKGDVIKVYGRFEYGNLGSYVGFSTSMPCTTSSSGVAYNVASLYCTGSNGTSWETYTTTYNGSGATGYLHLEIQQHVSYAWCTTIFQSVTINGYEILNSIK